jgi:hypothetical protein
MADGSKNKNYLLVIIFASVFSVAHSFEGKMAP